jgi:hypothetical protein
VNELRSPFLVLAIVLAAVAVLLELGSSHVLGGGSAGADLRREAEVQEVELDGSTADVDEPPGRAISYLALVDGILLYTVGLMGLSLVIPQRAHGRAQGVATLIGSIVLIIVAFILGLIALIELLVMVTLFLAAPFGTIAYLAIWGFFPRGEAAAVLSLLMLLKLAAAVFLVLAQQAFLKQKGLVALVLTSLVCNVIVAFLHGFVPLVVVSIVDTLSALIIAIIAIIWGIILLIGSIPSVVSSIRVGAGTG